MPDELFDRLRRADPLGGVAPQIPPLDDLGLDLAEVPSRAVPVGRRSAAWWRTSGLSVVIALLVGTGTAAAALTALTGDPLGRTPRVEVEPAAATVRLTGARSPDPDGGPAWGVRRGSAEGGLVCLAVGQVQGASLGLVGLDGQFRADRPRHADDCAVPPQPDRVTASARTFLGETKATAVSVVYGIAGRDILRVFAQYRDGKTTPIRLDADRVFVLAQRGSLGKTSPHLVGVVRPAAGERLSRTTDVDFGRRWIQPQKPSGTDPGAGPTNGSTR